MILKLCGVIAWSWWWVTCPLWAIPAIILLTAIFATIYDSIFEYKRNKFNESPEGKALEEKRKQRRRDGLEALSKMSIEANRMIEKERQEREEREKNLQTD